MTSKLFEPIDIGPLRLDNRIVVAPMCQYSAQEGAASDWHFIHLGHLSLSGSGLMILEATAVEPEGRISPVDLGLYDAATEAALRRVIGAIRTYSPIKLGIQLNHAGRKASSRAPWDGGKQIALADSGWIAAAPSALAHNPGEEPPAALTADGLARVKAAFVTAAERAGRIGFDMVELHAAHGYLLHQFLSPLANQRDDAYGGSLENRMRFPLEIFEATRAALPPHVPCGVRVSATDWADGGWDLDQTIVFAKELKRRGCAVIHVSTGGLAPTQKIPLGPGYQVPFAAAVKQATDLPTIAVGLITEPDQAEQIIARGEADMVSLARGMLYDPRWPWHAAATLGATVNGPKQYWRSPPREVAGLFRGAAVGQR